MKLKLFTGRLFMLLPVMILLLVVAQHVCMAGVLIDNVPVYVDKLSTSTPLTRTMIDVPKVEILPDGSLKASGGPLYVVSGGAFTDYPPAYGEWWRGCGPTSSGMMMGYWDTHGFDSLMPVDASTETVAVKNIIASQQHYDDYSLPLDDIEHSPTLLSDKSTTGGAHASNCLADYMNTSWSADGLRFGWTNFYTSSTIKKGIGHGLRTYTKLANPNYDAVVIPKLWGANISQGWTEFKAEIDAGYPVLLLVDTNGDNGPDHFVPAFGYDTVNGVNKYACYSTWDTDIHWYDFRAIGSGVTWGVGYAQLYHPKIKKIIRVSTTGNDANDGSSWANAMRTVKAAVSAATISDEIWVAEGTYTALNENISINTDIGIYGGFAGTESLRNERKPKQRITILDYEKGLSFTAETTDACIVDGFTIRTGASYTGAYCYVGSSPVLSNNNFETGNRAISSEGYPGPNVKNNIIKGNFQIGIYGVCNLIANNIISIPAGHALNGGGLKIINNTIVGCAGVGVYTVSTTSQVANNIISNNGVGVWKSADCTLDLSKNCLFGNATDYNVSVTPGSSDIYVNPLYVNYAGGNYHIQSGSPCVNAGNDSAISAGWNDMDGEIRTYGLHVDIGADEYMPVNTIPVANSQNVRMNKNAAKAITLTASDVNGDTLIYSIVVNPAHGIITGFVPDITYTPTIEYTGTDSFTFKVNDGRDDSETATVSITITEPLTSVVFDTNPASPVAYGKSVTLSAVPAGGASVVYKFMNGETILRDFAAGSTIQWVAPSVETSYSLSVIAKDLDAVNPNATVTSGKTVNVKPTLTAVSMITTPANQVLYGKPVTLTATATGGASVQYKFMNGAVIIRNFAASNTCTWTPASIKTYDALTVVARDLNGINPDAMVTSPAVSLTTKAALSSASLAISPATILPLGKQVILTATAVGGLNNQYKFMNGAVVIRNFAAGNSCTWTPAYIKTYDALTVVVKDLGGDDQNATVTSPAKILITKTALSSVRMVATPTAKCAIGKTVTLKAIPTGGVSLQYKFMNGAAVIRDFASSSTCVWTPDAAATCSLTVIAKDTLGVNPEFTVTSPIISYQVAETLTAASLVIEPNIIAIGTPVTLTATAVGGANLQYKFMNGTITIRNFSAGNTCVWTPAMVKTYSAITVVVKDLNGVDPAATVTSPTASVTVTAK